MRVLYVVPQDRSFRSDYAAAVGNALIDLQSWYQGQLAGKTFSLFSLVPETCRLPQAAAYYATDSWNKVFSDVQSCAPVSYNSASVVWVLYVDVVHACNTPGRLGAGTGGLTMLPRQDMDGLIGARYIDDCGVEYQLPPTRYVGGAGHELGHAFGLSHPPGCDAGLPTCDYNALMWAGYAAYPATYLRSDEKQILLSSPFFSALGALSGTVVNANGGAPIGNVGISLYDSSGRVLTATSTNSSGVYTMSVPAGTYFVQTDNSAGFINKVYNNVTCAGCDVVTSGTMVTVIAGQTTGGINFTLVVGGRISGRITNRLTGAPLVENSFNDVEAWIFTPTGRVVTYGTTDAQGVYVSRAGLPTGLYSVSTFAAIDPPEPSVIDETYPTLVTVTSPNLTSNIDFALMPRGVPTVTLDKTSLVFGAINSGAAFTSRTSPQAVRLTQTGTGTVTWTAVSNAPWLVVSPTSGSGSATLNVSVQFSAGLATTQKGTITLNLTGVGNTAGPVSVTLTTIPNGRSVAPVGAFDTPTDNSTGITGSIAVTGWAVDDIGVTRVRIMRNPLPGEPFSDVIAGLPLVFIGDAVQVDGARPDVAAAFPSSPRNTFAGWGYLMLTNFLPHLGNGTFVLRAVADDADGHSTILGTAPTSPTGTSKTITCTNSDIRAPFGAIDTPAQGGTVSGTVTNFGWVLVPKPAFADPPDGGTVRIVIDGALIAPVPGGWASRPDLSALFWADTFPGISKALGVAAFDTSSLANGVHTIAWLVTDNLGRAAGIGSRYFTVSNGSGLQLAPSSSMLAVRPAQPRHLSLVGRRGPGLTAPFEPLTRGADGVLTFRGEELDRIELRLQASGGHLQSAMGDLPLPIGSRIDPADGSFTWQPGPGFIGRYDLEFDTVDGSQRVQILLLPQGMLSRPQVVIDLPESGSPVSGQLTVAGWALDPNATADTGIDAIHVWAYPVHGGLPIFLGTATLGGERPDVAAIYGPQALKSGYGLIVNTLPLGEYDVAVFAWRPSDLQFLPASTRRVVVR